MQEDLIGDTIKKSAFYSELCDRIQKSKISLERERSVAKGNVMPVPGLTTPRQPANVSHSANVSQPEKRQKTQPLSPRLGFSEFVEGINTMSSDDRKLQILETTKQAMCAMPII